MDNAILETKAKEAALAKLLDYLNINFYWLDTQGYIQGVNQAVLDKLQLTEQEVIGKHSSGVVSEHAWENSQQAMLLQKTLTEEEIHYSEEGSLVFLSIKAPLIEKGHTIGLIGIGIDITQIKAAEETNKENEVYKRTVETLKIIAGSLSHELKTPLAGISLAMENIGPTIRSLLHYYDDSEANRETWLIDLGRLENLKSTLPKIKQQLDTMNVVIDMQLRSIRHEHLSTSFFDTHEMLNIVRKALESYPFSPEEQRLVSLNEQRDFSFWGEKYLMTNILWNLLKNALFSIKEADKGAISIWLDSDDSYNYLYFKDTGKGISADVTKKIFEKFYTNSPNGTGLGLAFCHAVMTACQGEITCQAEENEYALFILKFPLISHINNQELCDVHQ